VKIFQCSLYPGLTFNSADFLIPSEQIDQAYSRWSVLANCFANDIVLRMGARVGVAGKCFGDREFQLRTSDKIYWFYVIKY